VAATLAELAGSYDVSPNTISRLGCERLFVILTAYIDEAGTHKGSPLTAMGGYVARLGQWQHFDREWRRMLQRHSLTHVHVIDVLNGRNEFRGWTQDRALKLWREVEKITSKYTLFGSATFVSDKDYRDLYAADWPKKIPLDTRYGLCFRLITILVFKKVYENEKRHDLSLNMVLESGASNAGDAVRIFNLFKTHAPPHLAGMVGKITFGGKKEFPGLQAADGIASSVFRLEKLPLTEPYYSPHDTWDEPVELGRARINGRVPVYRIEATPSILRQVRESIIAQHGTPRLTIAKG